MLTQTFLQTLTVLECWSCGLAFGLTSDYERRRREDHGGFHCPAGHLNYFSAQTEAERLQKELRTKKEEVARKQAALDQERARVSDLRDEVAHQERRVNGYKGVVAKTKRRIAKGVCPCCSTQFKDLKTHMQSQHPDWNPDRAAEVTGNKSASR